MSTARLAAMTGEDPDREFDDLVAEAIDSLPPDLQAFMSNVAVVVEPEPPAGRPLLGLYQGVPLTRRGVGYAGALPDKISIYQGPLERHYGVTPETLRAAIRRVVLHEIAHHFGISDERLRELDRY
jgi:predicted Zn-dependent protease with MMP-like domain